MRIENGLLRKQMFFVRNLFMQKRKELNTIPYPFTLLDALNEGIYILDRQWHFLYVNNTGANIVERTRGGMLGKQIWELFPYLVGTPFFAEVRRAMEESIPTYIENYDLRLKKWFDVHCYPCPEGLIVLVQDITERKESEQRKDEFIIMASHELKTPITTMKSLMYLLQRKLAQQATQELASILSTIDEQIGRLTKLIDDLLNLTKIQAGRLDYEEVPVDIDHLVQETVALLQVSTPTHRLNIGGTTQATILGDKAQLRRVLVNLISNAVKYSPQAHSVDILLTSTHTSVQIAIRDYGIGIPAAAQQHLFERFYRVYGEREQTFPGLGMGLYIAYEIIKQHGGTIAVESQEGEGSTFLISLPIKAAPPLTSRT